MRRRCWRIVSTSVTRPCRWKPATAGSWSACVSAPTTLELRAEVSLDKEAIRLAMFAHPGVKSVDDVRLFHTESGGPGVIATIALVSPDVDQTVVRATVAQVLQQQFGVREVELLIKDPGRHRDIHQNRAVHCERPNAGCVLGSRFGFRLARMCRGRLHSNI
jgi:hypothetical protein